MKIINTSKRVYQIYERNGVSAGLVWGVSFRPINPKTGHVWQANRYVTEGHDCSAYGKYSSPGQVVSGILVGIPEGFDWLISGFSSAQTAEEACRRHMAKAKLLEVA